MKIEVVRLRELHMRLKAPFETSFGVTEQRRIVLVEAVVDGVTGWGEVTAAESPSFNYETTDTAWHIISDFIAPLVVGRNVEHASDFPNIVAAIRGHQMAKAAVENALWDAEAQLRSMPLATLLGGTRDEIACGVSLGIRENPHALLDKVNEELASGYQRIKLKIKPGKDLGYVAAVRVSHPDILLSVDANSAYTLADTEHLRALDAYRLLMIEQPLAWDDIYSHAKLQDRIQTAICLDECITGLPAAETAMQLHACRIINIKLGRVGGHSEAKKIESACRDARVPVWCGGMLESGIGRAHNIAMSTLPGFTLPGDVSASQRYWREDIIEPEVTVSPTGTITVPQTSGLGYAVRADRIEKLTVRKGEWKSRTAAA